MSVSGVNDWNALDTSLGDLGHPTKATLERAMETHVLAKAELVGTYQRGK